MIFFLFFRIFKSIRSSHLHSKICHPPFGFYLTKCLSGPSLPTMRFTQVAIIATLATAAFAAPVPNEDLDISLQALVSAPVSVCSSAKNISTLASAQALPLASALKMPKTWILVLALSSA